MRLTLSPQTVFEQNGVFLAKVLSLEGNNWHFQNHKTLNVKTLLLQSSVYFSNFSSLSEEEKSGTKEPQYGVSVGNLQVSENYTEKFINEGYLLLKRMTAIIPEVRNTGIWNGKSATIKKFQQGGKALFTGNLTVEELDQRGTLSASALNLIERGVNIGQMRLKKFSGVGSFTQARELFDWEEEPLMVEIKDFRQEKKTEKEPRLEAKKATFTSSCLINGESSHWLVNDLTIEGTALNTFTNYGVLKAKHLKMTRNFTNDGVFKTDLFKGFMGIIINHQDFTVTKADNLTISKLNIFAGASLTIGGQVTCKVFENQGNFAWTKGNFIIEEGFVGGKGSSIVTSENLQVFVGNQPATTEATSTKIIAKNFKNQGLLQAKTIIVTTDEVGNMFGFLNISEDVVFNGKAAVFNFENTPFSKSKITGNLKIYTPFEDIILAKEIILSRPLFISARSVKQEYSLTASQVNIKAYRINSKKSLSAKEDINLKAHDITIEETITSLRGRVNIQEHPEYSKDSRLTNYGTIMSVLQEIFLQFDKIENHKDILSQHSLSIKAANIETSRDSHTLASQIRITTQILKNAGEINAKEMILSEELQIAKVSPRNNTLTLTASDIHNQGILSGNAGSDINISNLFSNSPKSIFLLKGAGLILPTENLDIFGTFQVESLKSWKSQNGSTDHFIAIKPSGLFIVKDFDFSWNKFYNEGIFELNNSRAKGCEVYYATPTSQTLYLGKFRHEAPEFNKLGKTLSANGLYLIVGKPTSCFLPYEDFEAKDPNAVIHGDTSLPKLSVNNVWGAFEINGNLCFEISPEVDPKLSLQSFMNFDWKNCKFPSGSSIAIEAKNSDLVLSQDFKWPGHMSLKARSFDNKKFFSSYGLNIETSRHLENTGDIFSGSQLNIQAFSFSNSIEGQISGRTGLHIVTENSLVNSSRSRKGYIRRGKGRLFSENGNIFLQSQSGSINNSGSTIQAQGKCEILASGDFCNKAALVISLSAELTSRIEAKSFSNSLEWKYSNYERREHHRDVVKIKSIPGEIFIRGDLYLKLGSCNLDGGTLAVGGKIINKNSLALQAKQIGQYRGLVTANAVDLVLKNFNSQGGQLLIGPGGLVLQSSGIVTIASGDRSRNIRLQTVVNVVDVIKKYQSLFEKRSDGSHHLRYPERESNLLLDRSELVTDISLREGKPVNFSVSLEALQRIFCVLPLQEIGYFGIPQNFLAFMAQNAVNQSNRGVISQRSALNSSLPLLIWHVTDSEEEQKVEPILTFPQTLKRITDDVYVFGSAYLYAQKAITIDSANIYSKGPLSMFS